MNTGIENNKCTLTYDLSKALKTYNIYSLNTQKRIVCEPFTDLIKIENFRGFSNGKGFDKYLQLRDTSNWNTCERVTGVKPYKENIFFGDRVKYGKKSLIVFVFTNGVDNLLIDYYEGFYPNNNIELQLILNTYLNKQKRGA